MTAECERYRDDLPLLVAGGLADPARAALEAHLGTCPACRAEAAAWREVRDAVVAESTAAAAPVPVPVTACDEPVHAHGAARGGATLAMSFPAPARSLVARLRTQVAAIRGPSADVARDRRGGLRPRASSPVAVSAGVVAFAALGVAVLVLTSPTWFAAVRDGARAVSDRGDRDPVAVTGPDGSGGNAAPGVGVPGRQAGDEDEVGGVRTAVPRLPTEIARHGTAPGPGSGENPGGIAARPVPGDALARRDRWSSMAGVPRAAASAMSAASSFPPGTGPSATAAPSPTAPSRSESQERDGPAQAGPTPETPSHEHPDATAGPAPFGTVTPGASVPATTPDSPPGATVAPAPTQIVAGIVTGRALGGDGMGRAEVEVRAYPVDPDGGASALPVLDGSSGDGLHPIATTDVTGAYTLSVPAGIWILGVEAPVFQTQWYPDRSAPFVADPLSVAAGTVVAGIDFHLVTSPSSGVTGRVTSPDGAPVARAMVVGVHLADPSDPNDPGERRAVAFTTADGRYDLFLLPGVYALTVHQDWRAESGVWWDGKATLPMCDLLGIGADRLVEDIDFVLW